QHRPPWAPNRPRLAQLSTPELRRTTLATALPSASAYAAAFGALQLTPRSIVPGLADLADQRKALKPLQDEARELNEQLLKAMPEFRRAVTDLPGLQQMAAERAKVRIAQRALRKGIENPETPGARKLELKSQFGALTNRFAQLDEELNRLAGSKPDAKKAVIER